MAEQGLGHPCSALPAPKPSEEGLASGRCRLRGTGRPGSERDLISSQGQPGLGGHPAPPSCHPASRCPKPKSPEAFRGVYCIRSIFLIITETFSIALKRWLIFLTFLLNTEIGLEG